MNGDEQQGRLSLWLVRDYSECTHSDDCIAHPVPLQVLSAALLRVSRPGRLSKACLLMGCHAVQHASFVRGMLRLQQVRDSPEAGWHRICQGSPQKSQQYVGSDGLWQPVTLLHKVACHCSPEVAGCMRVPAKCMQSAC